MSYQAIRVSEYEEMFSVYGTKRIAATNAANRKASHPGERALWEGRRDNAGTPSERNEAVQALAALKQEEGIIDGTVARTAAEAEQAKGQADSYGEAIARRISDAMTAKGLDGEEWRATLVGLSTEETHNRLVEKYHLLSN